MIKIENVFVSDFEGAFRGMRNPLASWKKTDSNFDFNNIQLGPNDLKLAQKLIKAGPDHEHASRFPSTGIL